MPINQSGKNLTEFPAVPISETQVILENNQIRIIPGSIGNVESLQILYLRNNKITEVPSQIGNLKKLTNLLLGNNQISKLPSQIGNLTNLKQLRVENNTLTELPQEIGNLINLTHLFLNNNQLTSLPEEIKNLKKLVYFSIEGNSIALPPAYSQKKPNETIAYIFENQKEIEFKDSLITRKAFIFINASKPSISKKYSSLINKFSSEKDVDFIPIQSLKDINDNTSAVFIIAPFDTNDNEKLIFDIVNKCIKSKTRLYILIQKGFIEKDYEFANLTKADKVQKMLSQLSEQFPNESNTFSTYEELENIIFEALRQHKPNIRFTNLYLENIGHFTNLEIPFDKDLTCLVGENGTGKSTILRALALAIIGSNHKRIEEKTKKNFLKIVNIVDGRTIYNEGIIRLQYQIDGDSFSNEIRFIPNDDGRDISLIESGDFQIVYNRYNLKSLIVGFPQARGNETIDGSDFSSSKISQPHINDLLTLINNSDDYRLQSFAGWIANLYGESIKNKDNLSIEKRKEDVIIEEAFDIISKITKKEIKFKSVQTFAPPEIWVTTYDSPNGIPLHLISQGFKIIIGWVGFLLQRFISAFPLSDPKSAFKEKAILILDEIDTSIHPVWQTSLIDILREAFPNTQFIFTTHSPLIIAGLNREQVVELATQNNEVVALKNQIDTWALTYRDILQKFFDTTDPIPKKTVEELSEALSKTSDESEKESIKENIQRLQESDAYENKLAEYETKIIEKESELEKLILKYKDKLTK